MVMVTQVTHMEAMGKTTVEIQGTLPCDVGNVCYLRTLLDVGFLVRPTHITFLVDREVVCGGGGGGGGIQSAPWISIVVYHTTFKSLL